MCLTTLLWHIAFIFLLVVSFPPPPFDYVFCFSMGFGSNISTSMFWGLLVNFKLSSWFIFIFLWLVKRLALSNGLHRKLFLYFSIVGYTQPIRRPPSIHFSLSNLCKFSLMTPKATHTEYDNHYSYRNFWKTSSLSSLYGAKSLKPISCKYNIPFTWGRK